MTLPRATAPFWLLTVLALSGCAGQGGTGCTAIGGLEGIAVDVPRPLYDASDRARVRVCDDTGCATMVRRLEPWPQLPSPLATFAELGRDFEPGSVTVSVSLLGKDGSLVARRTDDVMLAPDFPNGRACDGDGYLQGSMRLTTTDRV